MAARRALAASGGRGRISTLAVAVGLVALSLIWCSAPARAASGGVIFLDDRPGYVDLDSGDVTWDVLVINTGDRAYSVSMQEIDDFGLLYIDKPSRQVIAPGQEADFRLRLVAPDNSSTPPEAGELLLIASDGSVERRPLTILHGQSSVPPPESLTFSGWLLAPLSGKVELPAVAASNYLDRQRNATLGVVESPVGRQGFVVNSGSTLHVVGIHGAGTYSGVAALTPGTSTHVVVNVRDTPLWPAIALLVGLVVVSRIDDYTKKTAPRRHLQIQLQKWKAKIEQTQRECATKVVQALGPAAQLGAPALIAPPGSNLELVYDRIAADALGRFDEGDEDVRNEWLSTGKAWEETDGRLDQCCQLLASIGELADDMRALQTRAGGPQEVDSTASLLTVRAALQPGPIPNMEDVEAKADDAKNAGEDLGKFARTLDFLDSVSHDVANEKPVRDLRISLLTGGKVDDILDQAGKLLTAEALKTGGHPKDLVPAPQTSATQILEVQLPPTPTPLPSLARSPRRAPAVVGLIGAAVAVLVVVAIAMSLQSASTRSAAPRQTTTTIVQLPFTGPSLLPVTAPLSPAVSKGPARSESAGTWIVEAGLLPLLVGLPLATILWLLLQRWLARRSAGDLSSLEAEQRYAQRRFMLVSGLIVLASGMAVLYVPNPHWGTLGDFITALLWGTGTTAGLSAARRFVPSR